MRYVIFSSAKENGEVDWQYIIYYGFPFIYFENIRKEIIPSSCMQLYIPESRLSIAVKRLYRTFRLCKYKLVHKLISTEFFSTEFSPYLQFETL